MKCAVSTVSITKRIEDYLEKATRVSLRKASGTCARRLPHTSYFKLPLQCKSEPSHSCSSRAANHHQIPSSDLSIFYRRRSLEIIIQSNYTKIKKSVTQNSFVISKLVATLNGDTHKHSLREMIFKFQFENLNIVPKNLGSSNKDVTTTVRKVFI